MGKCKKSFDGIYVVLMKMTYL